MPDDIQDEIAELVDNLPHKRDDESQRSSSTWRRKFHASAPESEPPAQRRPGILQRLRTNSHLQLLAPPLGKSLHRHRLPLHRRDRQGDNSVAHWSRFCLVPLFVASYFLNEQQTWTNLAQIASHSNDACIIASVTIHQFRRLLIDRGGMMHTRADRQEWSSLNWIFFFLRLPIGQYGPVSQLSRSEERCTGPFNWGEAHCAGEKVKRKIGPFLRKSLKNQTRTRTQQKGAQPATATRNPLARLPGARANEETNPTNKRLHQQILVRLNVLDLQWTIL